MAPARAGTVEPPVGFAYVDGLIEPAEEAALVGLLADLPWEVVVFRGYAARRRVVHFGHRYDFQARGVSPGLQIPSALVALRERVAGTAKLDPDIFVEVLATEYRPGATIGWHSDAPAFGAMVLGVSLASACRMRFRRRRAQGWDRWERTLEPRSAYTIGGEARTKWQHSIPPTESLRYSITYRSVTSRHRGPA